MEIKKIISRVVILTLVIVIVILAGKIIASPKNAQISLEGIPFKFSDIMINDTSEKLAGLYPELQYGQNTIHYVNSLELDCIYYRHHFPLAKSKQSIEVSYLFYRNKLIKKEYEIRDGGNLIDYFKGKLTEEFGKPVWSASNNTSIQIPRGSVAFAQTPPSAPIYNPQYKWDTGDCLIVLNRVTYTKGMKNIDLHISFDLKENLLLDMIKP